MILKNLEWLRKNSFNDVLNYTYKGHSYNCSQIMGQEVKLESEMKHSRLQVRSADNVLYIIHSDFVDVWDEKPVEPVCTEKIEEPVGTEKTVESVGTEKTVESVGIGDVFLSKAGGFYICENISEIPLEGDRIESRHGYYPDTDEFQMSNVVFKFKPSECIKATPEHELLFKQKCIENNVWWDNVYKVWEKLETGQVYKIENKDGRTLLIILKNFADGVLNTYVAYNPGSDLLLYNSDVRWSPSDISNISSVSGDDFAKMSDAMKVAGLAYVAKKEDYSEKIEESVGTRKIEESVGTRTTLRDLLNEQVGGNHYKKRDIQPIEYIMANELGFCEGSVVKYVTRHKDKNGAQDIHKAIQCLQFILAECYGEK